MEKLIQRSGKVKIHQVFPIDVNRSNTVICSLMTVYGENNCSLAA